MDKRRAVANEPLPTAVSYDALLGILDRECEKQNRNWYGQHETTKAVLAEIQEIDPDTRKEARQLILDRIDQFPLRSV